MMVPPVIRIGQVPAEEVTSRKKGFVVLIERVGWCIVKWHSRYGGWEDMDRHARRIYDPAHILCWMPENGE